MEIMKMIGSAEVVSFDIFDTLIYRIYQKPTDLFYHLELKYSAEGFCKARTEAETKARKQLICDEMAEVTLDEIYSFIDEKYVYLREKEIQQELMACKPNENIKELFYDLIHSDKKVFITSDMYLPEEVIVMLLQQCGFQGYDKLLLSSTEKKSKALGTLYDELISCAGELPNNIIHIGDNEYTDFEIAKSKGLKAYHYLGCKCSKQDLLHNNFFTTLYHYSNDDIVLSVLPYLTKEHEKYEKDYWINFGYNYIGVLATGYAQWLKSEFDKQGIKKAYFMLRDGHIIKRIFDKMYPEYKTEYLFGSRRMFLLAGMKNYDDIKFHTTGIHTKGLTFRRFWDRLAIEDPELASEYQKKFYNLDKIISSEDELKELDDFLFDHSDRIIELGKNERKIIIDYLDSIEIFDGKCAIVDLGWKCSMLKGLTKICKIEKREFDFYGYFIGTHECDIEDLNVYTYGIKNGCAYKGYDIGNVLNTGYGINILELAFSAPHPSIIKVVKENNQYKPLYQEVIKEEQERIDVCKKIIIGVLSFIDDYLKYDLFCGNNINLNCALAPLYYLVHNISKYDEKEIEKISFFPGVGADNTHFPITKRGMPSIALLNPWPGSISAEAEVITRTAQACKDVGIKCQIVDNSGHLCDENQLSTVQLLDINSIDFSISLHYVTPKVLDTFCYHTLWNPPEIPMNLDNYYDDITDNYVMYDDFLVYDAGGMSDHLKAMLSRKPRNIDNASMLTTSCPESYIMETNLSNPYMFYCGMNWEAVVHGTNRHEGLFKLLDKTGKVKFYGPEIVESWGGIRPWAGYKCYQGSIPFDGYSLIKEVNKCGICLVISSDIHRRAGAVTTRAYEALAAGAVIISDNNEYMQKWFRDAALFIEFNRNNPKDTYNQIMEKYNWIIKNPEQAKELAQRAQAIFRKYFVQDKALLNVVNNHSKRFETIATDLFAVNEEKLVLVTYTITSLNLDEAKQCLDRVSSNVSKQYYRNIALGVACDRRIYHALLGYLKEKNKFAILIPMDIFDSKGTQVLTISQCIAYIWDMIECDYFINTVADEEWYYDHITTLVRTIENNNAKAAYSGRIVTRLSGSKEKDRFKPITAHTVFYMEAPDDLPCPGQVLFDVSVQKYVQKYIVSSLDGMEHYFWLANLLIKNDEKVSFSKRMTFAYSEAKMDRKCNVLDRSLQVRFIRDLVYEEMQIKYGGLMGGVEQNIRNVELAKSDVANAIINVPLKLWIKLRLYQKTLALTKRVSKKWYEKNVMKYNELVYQYYSKM